MVVTGSELQIDQKQMSAGQEIIVKFVHIITRFIIGLFYIIKDLF